MNKKGAIAKCSDWDIKLHNKTDNLDNFSENPGDNLNN